MQDNWNGMPRQTALEEAVETLIQIRTSLCGVSEPLSETDVLAMIDITFEVPEIAELVKLYSEEPELVPANVVPFRRRN